MTERLIRQLTIWSTFRVDQEIEWDKVIQHQIDYGVEPGPDVTVWMHHIDLRDLVNSGLLIMRETDWNRWLRRTGSEPGPIKPAENNRRIKHLEQLHQVGMILYRMQSESDKIEA